MLFRGASGIFWSFINNEAGILVLWNAASPAYKYNSITLGTSREAFESDVVCNIAAYFPSDDEMNNFYNALRHVDFANAAASAFARHIVGDSDRRAVRSKSISTEKWWWGVGDYSDFVSLKMKRIIDAMMRRLSLYWNNYADLRRPLIKLSLRWKHIIASSAASRWKDEIWWKH